MNTDRISLHIQIITVSFILIYFFMMQNSLLYIYAIVWDYYFIFFRNQLDFKRLHVVPFIWPSNHRTTSKMASQQFVWDYFEKAIDNKAKCKKCGKLISCKGCSTSEPMWHLKQIQGVDPPTHGSSPHTSKGASTTAAPKALTLSCRILLISNITFNHSFLRPVLSYRIYSGIDGI